MIKRYDTTEVEYVPSPSSVVTPREAVLKPGSIGEYIAYGISQLGSPPVFGLMGLALIATSLTFSQVWYWLGLYLLLGLFTPMGFIVWQLRRGQITDLDIHVRGQRKKSMLVTIASFTAIWVAMLLGRAPAILTLLAGIGAIQWIIIFAITLRWKISVHSASATGVTLLILHVFGLSAVPLVVSLPLVAWSRVKLRHHTPAQTIAGTALGTAVFLIAVLVSPG
ncbi:MAG: phosphatase PAP2 family protein [Anaerolineae bacterium]|nr:phosphatase PAP2 family protein [Anaerolineae bacterium]